MEGKGRESKGSQDVMRLETHRENVTRVETHYDKC